MPTGLTLIRRDVGEGYMVFTRSDAEVFYYIWNADGSASVFHNDLVTPHGIDLGISVPDKFAHVEKLILAYPTGWPVNSSVTMH